MRTPREIYAEYKIMPSLQLHQLRVAAVGKFVCDNFTKPINPHDVILACLFHDMGNIIKSDLTVFPEFSEPEGLDYWQGVKDEYVKKYGADHHVANAVIAREIGLPESAYRLITDIGFSKIDKILLDASDEQKICEYGDLRVGPHGVLPMEERLEEGRRRYLSRKSVVDGEGTGVRKPDEHYQALVRSAKELEQQIFESATITPVDITDDAIKDIVEELRDYPID